MKLKISILEEGPMTLTGSKVLEMIQDNYTPPLDLLVRESIQNSADAILENKNFGKIIYSIGEFDKTKFSSCFETISENLNSQFTNSSYNFLAISDYNTCGLLGPAQKEKDGKPNNLYNLVYDIMNRKTESGSGGSHGIGKSVYYRYGTGLCIFYSRTFENGEYIHKLASALIQDETKDSCLLGNDTSGIAYFGDIINGKPEPLYDENQIQEFLSIFGLNIYEGLDTGTTVIIPFINNEKLLTNTVNENTEACYWLSNLNDSLDISIQRWYFARVNNDSFQGKQLKIAVNKKKVILNEFFSKLQELYNGTLENCYKHDVLGNKHLGGTLGQLYYKVFSKEELGMCPPSNFPSPKYMTDSSYDVDEKGLLFYLRKPGMVINYENSKFGEYPMEEDSYLVGIFILNDDACFNEENLGAYLRKSEQANHKEWNDINSDIFPYLKEKKPFRQIYSSIKKELTEKFKQTKAVSLDGGNTVLQKKLGEKLMPPSGFGNKPEVELVFPRNPKDKKESKSKVFLSNMNNDGTLSYSIEATFRSRETAKILLGIKVGGKTYKFNDWEKMNFSTPCKIKRIDIQEVTVDKTKISIPQNISLDEKFTKRRKKVINGNEIYKVRGVSTKNDNHCGIMINNCSKKKMTAIINLQIEPLDTKYLIGFDISFSEVEL